MVTYRFRQSCQVTVGAVREWYALVSKQQTSFGGTLIAAFISQNCLGCSAAWATCRRGCSYLACLRCKELCGVSTGVHTHAFHCS